MKREEKNQQTRRRIMDSALAEFSRNGYAAGSINNISGGKGLSKGIIYHYFDTKDDLFLACVQECFDRLVEHIRSEIQTQDGTIEQQINTYFALRMSFFQSAPVYQRIFCEAVITPPVHLAWEIGQRKQEFDALNAQILKGLLAPISLRGGITQAEAVDTFRQFQDFINARYQAGDGKQNFEARERSCRAALNIFLYGVIERQDG